MPARTLDLGTGWTAAAAPAGAVTTPDELDGAGLAWHPARVPGTAAGVLHDAGTWAPGDPETLDDEDWWFRTTFAAEPAGAGERLLLRLDGLATLSEVHLNGALVLTSESMFARHAVDVTEHVRADNVLAIRCASLRPRLRERRRPRARWRTAVAEDGNLRWLRTALLGRAPGFAPGPAAVGPWRPVRLERRSGTTVDGVTLRPRVVGDEGVLAVAVRLDGPAPATAEVVLHGPTGEHRAPLAARGDDGGLVGELRIPAVARWWPHTHGEPALYDVTIALGTDAVRAGRTGFRTLTPGPAPGHDVQTDGLDLHVNGVRVFTRGAVWTTADPIGLAPPAAELRARLERVRDAGMNMLRVSGLGAYEEAAFHDLCDELGILVWQDFMFANMDYPAADPGFRALVEAEADQVLADIGGRPSLAVLCGGSEIEQQAAMLGLGAELGRGELLGEVLPARVAAAGVDASWVSSSPTGGALPFRPDRGIANYYGVGGYRRPLEDARRAEVRFAGECLAFANVPDEDVVAALVPGMPEAAVVHHPRWKAGVPRDHGSGWDFEDVRDHYLRLLHDVDPGELRRVDHARYLELSRAVTGEVMAEVYGEWRRDASPCGGGLVLWLADLLPGAGWGVLDHRGAPKVAFHHLRRALAPIAVWTTDEGMNGIAVHVANDTAAPLAARLRVALHRHDGRLVEQAEEELDVAPHTTVARDVEALVGRFVDASWAYRFGPPGHESVTVTLERRDAGRALLSQSVRFPAGRPRGRESADALGLRASAAPAPGGMVDVTVGADRLLYGVRLGAPGWRGDDDAFCVAPGDERVVRLRPDATVAQAEPALPSATLTALNLEGRVSVRPSVPQPVA